MTAQRIDLFTEMTAAAEALVHDNTTPCKEDLQLEFRQIQKARRPELTTVEWLDLFDAWHEQYRALIEAKRARALEHFLSFIDQAARTNPPAPPFRCVCGAEGDPLIRSSSASTSHTSVSQDSTG